MNNVVTALLFLLALIISKALEIWFSQKDKRGEDE